MLLCVTQAAKKLQAKSFFQREMQEKLVQGRASTERTIVPSGEIAFMPISECSFIVDRRSGTEAKSSVLRLTTKADKPSDSCKRLPRTKKVNGARLCRNSCVALIVQLAIIAARNPAKSFKCTPGR
jgi:hypothetical protein